MLTLLTVMSWTIGNGHGSGWRLLTQPTQRAFQAHQTNGGKTRTTIKNCCSAHIIRCLKANLCFNQLGVHGTEVSIIRYRKRTATLRCGLRVRVATTPRADRARRSKMSANTAIYESPNSGQDAAAETVIRFVAARYRPAAPGNSA